MNPLASTMNVITAVLSVYMLLLMIRIILTWFQHPGSPVSAQAGGKAAGFLARITDPYLNLFRGMHFLRAGMLDFSPVFAMVVLGMVIQLTSAIGQTGQISFGLISALLVTAVWGVFSFILEILIVFMVIRFISTFFRAGYSPLWRNLDNLLYRVIEKVLSLFTDRELQYRTAMLITGGIFLAVVIAGEIGIRQLSNYLYNLPF